MHLQQPTCSVVMAVVGRGHRGIMVPWNRYIGRRMLLATALLACYSSNPASSHRRARNTGPTSAAPPPGPLFDFGRFPHFQWRARVLRALAPAVGHSGSTPPSSSPLATTTFTLFDRHHACALSGNSTSVTANASEWSTAADFTNATVAVALAVYPNTLLVDSPFGSGYDQKAGQKDYPALVTSVQVSGVGRDCVNRSRVQLEITFAPEDAQAGGTVPFVLDATLAGCTNGKAKGRHECADCAYLGLLIGRNTTTGEPMVTTFRQWNARTYWAVLDALQLEPLQLPPRIFPLMDELEGDDDVDMWSEGIEGMARLGFHGVVVGNVNLTQPLTERFMDNKITTGPGKFLPARNSWSVSKRTKAPVPLNATAWTALAREAVPDYLDRRRVDIGDVTCAYMSMEPSAGAVAPLPPVSANAQLATRWQHYLQTETGLSSPSDFGASTWAKVLPAGRPMTDELSARRRYYWTTRL